MKSKFKLFCFGFGQVAKYFVTNLINKKIAFDLITTNTKNAKITKQIHQKSKKNTINRCEKLPPIRETTL